MSSRIYTTMVYKGTSKEYEDTLKINHSSHNSLIEFICRIPGIRHCFFLSVLKC